MYDMKEATASFGNKLKDEEWNLDEEITNEGWQARDVHEILNLKENMNNLRISKRVVPRRAIEKSSANNVRRWIFTDFEEEKLENNMRIKDPTITASLVKKSLKEEIHELLMCWANERKKKLLNPVKENRCKYRVQARKAKSHTIKYSKEDFITMRQIPPLK